MWLRLLQYGSVLEAYDSAGLAWSGSISMLAGGAAQLQPLARPTAGPDARIAGTLRHADRPSTLAAARIEPAFAGSPFPPATVNPHNPPASPPPGHSQGGLEAQASGQCRHPGTASPRGGQATGSQAQREAREEARQAVSQALEVGQARPG